MKNTFISDGLTGYRPQINTVIHLPGTAIDIYDNIYVTYN